MDTLKKTIGVFFVLAMLTLAIDFAGFVAWVASGQHPVDGFYVGRITTEIIKALI